MPNFKVTTDDRPEVDEIEAETFRFDEEWVVFYDDHRIELAKPVAAFPRRPRSEGDRLSPVCRLP